MISHSGQNASGNSSAQAINLAVKELGIRKLLSQCNIRKKNYDADSDSLGSCSVLSVFLFLISLVFEGRNLFQFLNGKKGDEACSKNTYYRFLNNARYNWAKFIIQLGAVVASKFTALTRPERISCLVLDDSTIERSRSKKVELLSRVHDHNTNKFPRGFKLMMLNWTDGYSSIPVNYLVKTTTNPKKLINGMKEGLDKRTNAYKTRVRAMMSNSDSAIELILQSLAAGIQASYLLADSWFANEPFMHRVVTETGLHFIGMHRRYQEERFIYRGKTHILQWLGDLMMRHHPGNASIFGSVVVETKEFHMPIKLVFVRNRANKSDYIILMSTDCSLSAEEIVRLYGERWSIECCFKACKSLFKLGREFQGISYDLMVSSTAIALTRYILIEWIRRKNNDLRSMCELFYVCCDDIQDMELATALQTLVSIFFSGIKDGRVRIDETIHAELLKWYVTLPGFIKMLIPAFLDECEDAKALLGENLQGVSV